MKIKVLNSFPSQFNPKAIYEKDSVYDFPEARAKELIVGGFAEEAKEDSDDTKAKAEAKAKESEKKES